MYRSSTPKFFSWPDSISSIFFNAANVAEVSVLLMDQATSRMIQLQFEYSSTSVLFLREGSQDSVGSRPKGLFRAQELNFELCASRTLSPISTIRSNGNLSVLQVCHSTISHLLGNDQRTGVKPTHPHMSALTIMERPGSLHLPKTKCGSRHPLPADSEPSRFRIIYHDNLRREWVDQNLRKLLRNAQQVDSMSNDALLARKALRYRRVLDRVVFANVDSPSFDASVFVGVEWQHASKLHHSNSRRKQGRHQTHLGAGKVT